MKNELSNVKDDRDKYHQENQKLLEKKEFNEKERKKIIIELKELKQRESRMHLEINELEEENISLQKQVSSLKSSQVDFETFKLEITRLQGEIEILQTQIEESIKLKGIADKQVCFSVFTFDLLTFFYLFIVDRLKKHWKLSNRKESRNMLSKKNWIRN